MCLLLSSYRGISVFIHFFPSHPPINTFSSLSLSSPTMASQERQSSSLYPKIDPQSYPNYHPSSSSMYPSIDLSDLVDNLFPDIPNPNSSPSAPPAEFEVPSVEETLIRVPGAVVHLIDNKYSVELAIGEFSVVRIRQGANIVAVLARVADEVQWPLVKEEAVVKVDDSRYFFAISDSLHCAEESEKAKNVEEDVLNYGLSFASKGQEEVLRELDKVFEMYGSFTVAPVSERSKEEVAGAAVVKEISPEELEMDVVKREAMERNCGAYWTTLAPNVEEYSSATARLIASGSGHVIKGILWCGDVTVDRLKWGQDVLRKRLDPGERKELDKNTLKRIRRAKRMTKMTKKVATGVLSGVVRVSGFFTSSVANSKVGKKFFSLLPGEMVLASLDGFNRICDAVEVAGKEVMTTTNTVTTGLVTHKYGEEAGKATHEGLGAAGHAIGTAWTVFKIRKALNPKGALKPTSLAKSAVKAAASEYKSQKSSKK